MSKSCGVCLGCIKGKGWDCDAVENRYGSLSLAEENVHEEELDELFFVDVDSKLRTAARMEEGEEIFDCPMFV